MPNAKAARITNGVVGRTGKTAPMAPRARLKAPIASQTDRASPEAADCVTSVEDLLGMAGERLIADMIDSGFQNWLYARRLNWHCKYQFKSDHGRARLCRHSQGGQMRLTRFADYGLRILMRLASDPARAFSTGDIAQEFDLSRHHLAKVMQMLASHGYVKTRRGKGGGAVLARPAEEIRIGDVVRLLERGHALVECFAEDGGACGCMADCRLKYMFADAEERFFDRLNRHTLADCALPKPGTGTPPDAPGAAGPLPRRPA